MTDTATVTGGWGQLLVPDHQLVAQHHRRNRRQPALFTVFTALSAAGVAVAYGATRGVREMQPVG